MDTKVNSLRAICHVITWKNITPKPDKDTAQFLYFWIPDLKLSPPLGFGKVAQKGGGKLALIPLMFSNFLDP